MWEVHSGARWLVEAGERRNWNSSDSSGKHLGKTDGGELRSKDQVFGGKFKEGGYLAYLSGLRA